MTELKADGGPKPPESFVRDCDELGFEIGGWDGATAGIFGHGAEFVGSHVEVMAFLRGSESIGGGIYSSVAAAPQL